MFGLFRKKAPGQSAATARDRLHILLAHERRARASLEVLPLLQRDIMEAIERRMEIGRDAVEIRISRDDDLSTLEINIDLPGAGQVPASA